MTAWLFTAAAFTTPSGMLSNRLRLSSVAPSGNFTVKVE